MGRPSVTPADLDALLEEIWRRLERGAADRRAGFRTLQLASLGQDGHPRVRTVVLRAARRAERQLRLHTDARSPKVAELTRSPAVELCAYDARAGIQLRLRGRVEVHAGPTADAAWAASQPGSLACYRNAFAPGTELGDPALADPPPGSSASPPAQHAGRENFRVLLVNLEHLEWLELAASGHRRASFLWTAGRWAGGWRAP